MICCDEWLQFLTASVIVRVCKGRRPYVKYDHIAIPTCREGSIFKDVIYTALYRTREILKRPVISYSDPGSEIIYLSDEDDCEYNDRCMCSWYAALVQLNYENDNIRQGCVNFLRNSAVEICRQLLELRLIDRQQHGGKFPATCKYT